MEDERTHLRRTIEHYVQLLKGVTDQQLCHELEGMIEEARQRLEKIERRG